MVSCVLLMIDGLRPDAITPERTPALQSVIERGATSLQAQSVMPSVTLPCHTSIFHSIPPERHGIMDNDWHSMARPVRGLADQIKLHDRKAAFIYNWEPLRNLSKPGSLYYSYFIDSAYDLQNGDARMAEAGVQAIQSGEHDFIFLYFGTVDSAGHAFGWMTDGYFQQVAFIDTLVQRVLDALPASATIIIQADHGGHDRTHGTPMPEDMNIPWIIAGPRIAAGARISVPVSLLDTAPTIAHVLGIPAPADWEGSVIHSAFLPV